MLFAPLVRRGRSTNVFLPNGGRLYLDVGAHPEYATAECSDLWDLLAQVRAGSALLADMAAEANEELRRAGVPGTLHLFANNLDSAGNSFGCHENYLLRRSRNFREMADALITFFVTRQIVVGAGSISEDDAGRAIYVLSPRADQMHDALSGATTRARPIINTRDEPLSDSTSYRRLHVIVGDTNVAEPTTALKVASTDMVLHAMESGVDFSDLVLDDPMEAIRQINTDLTGTQTIALQDGRKMTAVELQKEIKRRTLSALSEDEIPELYVYLLNLWDRALQAFSSADWSGVDREIDFAIKKRLLDSYRDRTGADWDDPRVTRLALAYHDITEAGIFPRLEDSGAAVRLTTPDHVLHAQTHPPATTRAVLRGRVIAAAQAYRRDVGVDWVNLRLEGAGMSITLQDPFATRDDGVEALLARISHP